MKPVTDPPQLERYRRLIAEMMLSEEHDECEFNPDWIRSRGWKVVPAEPAGGHFAPDDLPRLASVLNSAGCYQCIAVATEPLGDMPTCYIMSVDAPGFREFNRELGPLRFVLTDDDASWAISFTEWYNLFAAKPELLEAISGKPIDRARWDYLKFASDLAKQPDEPLLNVASRYASL